MSHTLADYLATSVLVASPDDFSGTDLQAWLQNNAKQLGILITALGSAAYQPTSAFDAAGAAATAQSTAEAFAANADNLASGTVNAARIPTLNQSTTGNAATATKLATARTIAATGDVSYTSPSFDGSGNVTAAATIAASAVTLAKMANLAANSIIGNNTGSPAVPAALTTTQVIALLGLSAVATSGAASDVSGLAAVATSGAAADVSGLATVATSGAYGDLSGLPALNSVATATELYSDGGGFLQIGISFSSDSGFIFSDSEGNLQGTSFIAQAYTDDSIPALKVVSAYPDYATTFTVDGLGNIVATSLAIGIGYGLDNAGNLNIGTLNFPASVGTGTPVDASTVVGWLPLQIASTLYYMPLYQ